MSSSLLLTAPNVIGLPSPERGEIQMPATYKLIEKRWPQINRLLANGQAEDAVSSMETLAKEMLKATITDEALFRDALTQARQILYDDIAQVGRAIESEECISASLKRCAAWDQALQPHLIKLISHLK